MFSSSGNVTKVGDKISLSMYSN